MPILEINILGSKIKIGHQDDEKEILSKLIDQFKNRLSEFNNLKGRFSDNKIIFLAALKAEDEIFNLKKNNIDNSQSLKKENEKIENKNSEIVKLKDQITSLKNENQELSNQKEISFKRFKDLNERIELLINKIMEKNKNDNR